MRAFTAHICDVWSSVIATEHILFTSHDVVIALSSSIASMSLAKCVLIAYTLGSPPGLKESPTAFSQKLRGLSSAATDAV